MRIKKALSMVTIATLLSPMAFANMGDKKAGYSKDKMKTYRGAHWSGDTVKSAQKKLNTKGFNAGPVDGIIGSQTKQAIKDFQRSEGLPVTGTLNRQIFETLGVEDVERASESYSE